MSDTRLYHFFVLDNSDWSSDWASEQHYALVGDEGLRAMLLAMRPTRDRLIELFGAMRAVVPGRSFFAKLEVGVDPLPDVLYFDTFAGAVEFLQQHEAAVHDTDAYRDYEERFAEFLGVSAFSIEGFADDITVNYAGMPVFPIDLPPLAGAVDRMVDLHIYEGGWSLVFHGSEKQFSLP